MTADDYGMLAADALPNFNPQVLRAIAEQTVDVAEVMDSCQQWAELRHRQAEAKLAHWEVALEVLPDVREKLTNPQPQWVERWKTF